MKCIKQAGPYSVKVETVLKWPKCDFCGCCHPSGDSAKCPRIKWFDRNFDARRS